jgi:phenylalanyl-tRNA synthetase alpha chain
MEGVRLLSEDDVRTLSVLEQKKLAELDLKEILSGLAQDMFGDVEMRYFTSKMLNILINTIHYKYLLIFRWKEDYFPFTEPSFELEVKFNGNWLEVLGCGVIHDDVLSVSGRGGRVGWAFGLGLERLAMILFGIPDIRLFWSQDERFSSQFKKGVISKFVPYSKYPLCYKDVSFWLPENKNSVHVNDIYEVFKEHTAHLILLRVDSFSYRSYVKWEETLLRKSICLTSLPIRKLAFLLKHIE